MFLRENPGLGRGFLLAPGGGSSRSEGIALFDPRELCLRPHLGQLVRRSPWTWVPLDFCCRLGIIHWTTLEWDLEHDVSGDDRVPPGLWSCTQTIYQPAWTHITR